MVLLRQSASPRVTDQPSREFVQVIVAFVSDAGMDACHTTALFPVRLAWVVSVLNTPTTDAMEPLPALLAYFQDLDAPCIERSNLHNLIDIVFIAICAVRCGAEG